MVTPPRMGSGAALLMERHPHKSRVVAMCGPGCETSKAFRTMVRGGGRVWGTCDGTRVLLRGVRKAGWKS